MGRAAICAVGLVALLACSRETPAALVPVEPIGLDALDPADAALAPDIAAGAETQTPPAAPAAGGLWVVDAAGQPIAAVVQRGHPSLSAGGQLDILRDGVVVYSPKAGISFGLQMSTGKVVVPRLGVADGNCNEPIVAGYYTEGAMVSGYGYGFTYRGQWYRVREGQPVQLVTCAGTVADGVDAKCAPHTGSCRGFPIDAWPGAPLPTSFPAPLAFAWLAGG